MVALERVKSDKQGNAQWNCICDCGNTVVIRGGFLLKGQSYCSRQCKLWIETIALDLTGKRFGRLIAIERVAFGEDRKAIWRFVCDCGSEKETLADYVVCGDVKSCGCLGIESRITHGLSHTRDYHNAYTRQWAERYPARAKENVYRRQRGLKDRTPPWLTTEHKAEINGFYLEAARVSKETGIKHHVDHIFPLRGKTSSGLHVPWNLRVIPAIDNLRKARSLPDDVC